MSKVYSTYVAQTQQLLNGLSKNIALIEGKGINRQFIARLELNSKKAEAYNTEIEKLKAEVKAKISEANALLREVKVQVKEAKRVIKKDFDPGQWQSFGINDKR